MALKNIIRAHNLNLLEDKHKNECIQNIKHLKKINMLV